MTMLYMSSFDFASCTLVSQLRVPLSRLMSRNSILSAHGFMLSVHFLSDVIEIYEFCLISSEVSSYLDMNNQHSAIFLLNFLRLVYMWDLVVFVFCDRVVTPLS